MKHAKKNEENMSSNQYGTWHKLATNVLLIAPFIQLFDSYPIPTPSPMLTP